MDKKLFALLVFLVGSLHMMMAVNTIGNEWDWPCEKDSEVEAELMKGKLILIEEVGNDTTKSSYNQKPMNLSNAKNVITFIDTTNQNVTVVKFYRAAQENENPGYIFHLYNIENLETIKNWIYTNPKLKEEVIGNLTYFFQKKSSSEDLPDSINPNYIMYGIAGFLLLSFIILLILQLMNTHKVKLILTSTKKQSEEIKTQLHTIKSEKNDDPKIVTLNRTVEDTHTLITKIDSQFSKYASVPQDTANIKSNIKQIAERIPTHLIDDTLHTISTDLQKIMAAIEDLPTIPISSSPEHNPAETYEDNPASQATQAESITEGTGFGNTPLISLTEQEIITSYNEDADNFKHYYNPERVNMINWKNATKAGTENTGETPQFTLSTSQQGFFYVVEQQGTNYLLPFKMQSSHIPNFIPQVLACFDGVETITEKTKLVRCAQVKRTGETWELIEKGRLE